MNFLENECLVQFYLLSVVQSDWCNLECQKFSPGQTNQIKLIKLQTCQTFLRHHLLFDILSQCVLFHLYQILHASLIFQVRQEPTRVELRRSHIGLKVYTKEVDQGKNVYRNQTRQLIMQKYKLRSKKFCYIEPYLHL